MKNKMKMRVIKLEAGEGEGGESLGDPQGEASPSPGLMASQTGLRSWREEEGRDLHLHLSLHPQWTQETSWQPLVHNGSIQDS